jgi:hypothetical protein
MLFNSLDVKTMDSIFDSIAINRRMVTFGGLI